MVTCPSDLFLGDVAFFGACLKRSSSVRDTGRSSNRSSSVPLPKLRILLGLRIIFIEGLEKGRLFSGFVDDDDDDGDGGDDDDTLLGCLDAGTWS